MCDVVLDTTKDALVFAGYVVLELAFLIFVEQKIPGRCCRVRMCSL